MGHHRQYIYIFFRNVSIKGLPEIMSIQMCGIDSNAFIGILKFILQGPQIQPLLPKVRRADGFISK